ncbi:hypothetical protein M501DRAFT_999389, partial [Patellaria atrata CBS 101060]
MPRKTVLKLKSVDNLVNIGVLTQPYFQIWPVAYDTYSQKILEISKISHWKLSHHFI